MKSKWTCTVEVSNPIISIGYCMGEFEPHINVHVGTSTNYECSSSGYQTEGNYEAVEHDVVKAEFVRTTEEKQPNKEARKFYNLLKVAQRP